jgi:hypothetical protein
VRDRDVLDLVQRLLEAGSKTPPTHLPSRWTLGKGSSLSRCVTVRRFSASSMTRLSDSLSFVACCCGSTRCACETVWSDRSAGNTFAPRSQTRGLEERMAEVERVNASGAAFEATTQKEPGPPVLVVRRGLRPVRTDATEGPDTLHVVHRGSVASRDRSLVCRNEPDLAPDDRFERATWNGLRARPFAKDRLEADLRAERVRE